MADLPAPPQPADSWSMTEARVLTHNHLWTIKGFSNVDVKFLETTLTINDDQIEEEEDDDEPEPPSAGNEPAPIKFKLRMHPKGNRDSNKEYAFFQAFMVASPLVINPYKYRAKFTVYNSRNEELHTTVYVGTQQVRPNQLQLMGHFEYVRREQLLQHIRPTDELRLHLSLQITTEPLTETSRAEKKEQEEEEQIVPNYQQISKDLESFMQTGKLTDFKIELHDGREIECHKAMLAARSPVFQAMLEPHTEESQTGKVAIGDVEYEVMHEMLRFIYTGIAPSLSVHALDLLAIADRYALQGLKDAADKHLRNSLAVETVSRTLVHADMHNATELRKAAISFIAANMSAVIATDGWAELVKQQGAPLVNEILGTLVKPNAARARDDDDEDEDDSDAPPPAKRTRRNARI